MELQLCATRYLNAEGLNAPRYCWCIQCIPLKSKGEHLYSILSRSMTWASPSK